MEHTPTASAVDLDRAVIALKASFAVLAKAAKQDATKAFTKAEADVIAALLAAGIESITTDDGTKVTLKGGLDGESARSIDMDLLAERVTAATLDRVTKRSVDLSAFDSAVEVGLIDPATVAAVTTVTDKKRSIVITSPIKR